MKHKYRGILNKHTVKLSYSTTPNLERIIAKINGSRMMKPEGKIEGKTRNKDIRDNSNVIREGIPGREQIEKLWELRGY